jgi:hypothetical protein
VQVRSTDPAATALLDRIYRTPTTRGRQARRPLLSVVALAACGAAAGVIALTTAHGGGRSVQRYQLMALRVPRTSSDTLPVNALGVLAHTDQARRFGLRVNESRRVGSVGKTTMWLIPGAKQTCLVTTVARLFTGEACAVSRQAVTHGMSLTVGQGQVSGVLPYPSQNARLITASGATLVRVHENADGAFSTRLPPHAAYLEYDGIGHHQRRLALNPAKPGSSSAAPR